MQSTHNPHDTENIYSPTIIATRYVTTVSLLSEDARKLLDVLSWLAPDPMPMRHLANYKELAKPRVLLMELVNAHLAILSADSESFSIPSLLQEITRARQSEKEPTALISALGWIFEEYPDKPDDERTWPIALPLIPHAVSVAYAEADRRINVLGKLLLNGCALFLKSRGDFLAAEPLYRKALSRVESAMSDSDILFAIQLQDLAELMDAMNRIEEEEQLLTRALRIWERVFGKKHAESVLAKNKLNGVRQKKRN